MDSSPSIEVGKAERWRVDAKECLKTHELEKLSGSAEGLQHLQEFKKALDNSLQWCDTYREAVELVATHPSAPHDAALPGTHDAAAEASKAKQDEFTTALEAMATHAQKLRETGAKCERVITFTNDTLPQTLIEFVQSLPNTTPTLGYEARHVANIASTVRRVVAGQDKRIGEREHLARFLQDGAELDPGIMALAREGPYEGFELFMAGILYTADLTEKVKQEDGSLKDKSIWINDPSKQRDPTPQEEEILGNHGIFKKTSAFMSTKLALYFVMNAAMREAPKYLEAGEDSIFTCAKK
eukprot:Hpha_TRINITY_DN15388_c1_g4::TRINITY_DN15388_c1_g4_i1::g.87837::m.87837